MRKILLTLLTTLLCSIGTQAETPTATTAGTYSFGSTNIGAKNKFGELSTNSVFIYRNSSYGTGNSGIKMNSENNSGWVFYLTSSMTLSVKIYQNSATAETITLWVKTVPSSFFQSLVDGTANSTVVSAPTLTASGSKEETLSSGKNEKTVTYGSTLTAGYYYVYATSAASSVNTYLRSITLASASCSTAPTITVAPSSATYCVGNTATALGYTSATATAQKWQVSTDNSEWNDISPAQTGTTYTPSTASAGTTYYRVIATCDSYTHSATSDPATITVKANHSVTAATSSGTNTYGTVTAASASVCEGSTTTVTASPASGYKVTNWAVTGTGASVSPSGASNSNTTTLTMGTADATVTVTFGCKAPTSPSVSGTTAYTEGQDISLTAYASDKSASATYTWYKGATWDVASATSSIHSGATLSINDCVEGDAGTYWCNISNGTGCDVQTSKTITVSGACTDPSLTITLN